MNTPSVPAGADRPSAGRVPVLRTVGGLGLAVVAPLALVGILIAVFLSTRAGLDLETAAPIEHLTVERVVLKPGLITVHIRNTGPSAMTVALVNVNDSTWPAVASPSNEIPRLGTAALELSYPWVRGEAYKIAIVTANGIVFDASIPVAFTSPQPNLEAAGSFALIGLYIGVLPIALGMLWFPAMRRAGQRTMLFLIAFTAGLLVVLGIETLAESIEQAGRVASPFQGTLLVGLGVFGMIAVLTAATFSRKAGVGADSEGRWRVAYLIALGIGLHNLGEGLAIGAAYSLGEIALGGFLVLGFILQNLTEGIAIVMPILRERVRLRQLAVLVAVAGSPAVVGTLVGAFNYSLVLSTLFLAIGAGAILQVLMPIGQMALRDVTRLRSPYVGLAGFGLGMLLLYAMGTAIK